MQNEGRLAVLGAGHVGPVIARLAIRAGYPVAIATSGDPDDIALITELVIPGAEPRWASDAVADADIVVLAIPLHRLTDVDPALLADKVVVDAVAELTDRIGYDPVRLGGLPAGRVLQPGGPVFGQVLTVPEFERAVHQDARSLR